MMKRRTFIKRTLIAVAALPVAGTLSYWLKKVTPEEFITDVIHNQLAYLQVDDTEIQRFATAYLAHQQKYLGNAELVVKILVTYEDWFTKLGVKKQGYVNLRENIARSFLLSSDFFQHGADSARAVKFVGIYDPCLRPCSNPFIHYG